MSNKDRSSLAGIPLLSIAAAAFAVEIPFFFFGTPSGHDVEFHLYSWLEVLSQWKHGIFYPRWASLAHFGYGEPRFLFYPPASWTLGAALSALFSWTLVPSIYIWLVLVGAGVSMFLLARQWLDRRDAVFAAVLYAVNPYHLVIVYWRSAFAELLAAAVLPLLLLLALRADELLGDEPGANELRANDRRRRCIVILSAVLAASWLINAPAAVMTHYSLALLLLVVAWQRRSPRIFAAGGCAVLFGAALAAFYLFPAIYEQKWVDIAQSVSPGSRPLDNFLFVHTTDADHDAFNRLISWVAIAEITVTAAAAWAARGWRRLHPKLFYSLVIWGGVCGVFMVSVSNPVWDMLPKLRFMQFPWRWLLCLGTPLTLLIAIGLRNRIARAALYLGMLCVLIFVWHHFQSPWWDTAADLREMQDNMATGAGYEGTDEYTPTGADPTSIDKTVRHVTVAGPARASIRVLEWSAEHKLFTADMAAPDHLVLHLFDYPAWRVSVNGREVIAGTREGTGQMLVPAAAGMNRVEIIFVRTWDRTAGAWISVGAVLLGFGLVRKSKLPDRPA